MARGGFRPGAGRPRGAKNRTTAELAKWVSVAIGDDLASKLTSIAEDPKIECEIRLEAMRRLSGLLLGRIVVSSGSREVTA